MNRARLSLATSALLVVGAMIWADDGCKEGGSGDSQGGAGGAGGASGGSVTTTFGTGALDGGSGGADAGGSGGSGGSTHTFNPTGSGGGSTGVGGSMTAGAWTSIPLMDSAATPCSNDGATFPGGKVSAIWFSSLTNGDVALRQCNGGGGLIEHLDGATHIDAIALDGAGALPGNMTDAYFGLWSTPVGLLASGLGCSTCFTDPTLIVSADMGKSFAYSQFSGTMVPSGTGDPLGARALWISIDSSGATHIIDPNLSTGAVWSSPTGPGPTATFTLTFTPGPGAPGGCTNGPVAYYTTFPQTRTTWVSPDGTTMMYGAGNSLPVGVCRSTDGGHSFVPIAFPSLPQADTLGAPPPFVILFPDATHGIAAGGGQGYPPILYYSTDAGASWAPATFPPSAQSNAAIVTGFVSADGNAVFLAGAQPGTGSNAWLGSGAALLYESTDGGKTWTDLSAGLIAAQGALNGAVAGQAPGFVDIFAGFALDATHVWIGTDQGGLFYSSTGGQ